MRALAALVLALAVTAGSMLADPVAAEAATTCPVFATESRMPSNVRVRMSNTGRIVRVPLALYVARVMSSEWNSVSDALQRAGAVAVRQYVWYKSLRPRRSAAGCFDVHSDTRDQIYRVKEHALPDRIWDNLKTTWGWRIVANGRLIQTGYRTGRRGLACMADYDGYHLFARSAKACVRNGWSARRILSGYYRGRLVVA